MTDIPRDNGLVLFLRKRDKYAQPINLTYNRIKEYPTACGGALSILSTLVLIAWLAFQIKYVVLYSYTTSYNLTLNITAGNPNVDWQLDPSDLLLASSV